jgi:hypothetical protein
MFYLTKAAGPGSRGCRGTWITILRMQDSRRYGPPSNQVGVVAATVLLCFALTHLAAGPGLTMTVQFPGFYFAYSLTLATAMTLVAAGLTATGMDWILHSHPGLEGRATLDHWLLPGLTAFIIGVLLDILPAGNAWWIGFAAGAALLLAVLVAEYIALDPGAPMYTVASAGLIALSHAIFLLFVIALQIGGARLFVVIPAIFVAGALVSLRTLHLRLGGQWDLPWAIGIGLICSQLAASLHYWPLSALQLGLALLGPLYALTALASSLDENVPVRSALAEPGIILAGLWAVAVLVR